MMGQGQTAKRAKSWYYGGSILEFWGVDTKTVGVLTKMVKKAWSVAKKREEVVMYLECCE